MVSKLDSLSHDLLKLYCKTKCPKVEDLYLRVFAAAKVSFYDLNRKIKKWQDKHDQLVLGLDILNALDWIYDWFDESNYGTEANPLALKDAKKRLNPKTVSQILPAIYNETSGPFGTLLGPAKPFLKAFIDQAGRAKETLRPDSVKEEVIKDLTKIQDWLIKEGPEQVVTPEESAQRAQMYTALLQKFSGDLAKAFYNAVETVGGSNTPQGKQYINILTQIRQGALADSNKFSGVLDLPINQLMYREAEEVVDLILPRSSQPYFAQNVEIIKNKALKFVGATPKPDPYKPETHEKGYEKPAPLPEQVRQDPSKAKFTDYTPTAKDFEEDEKRRRETIIPDEQWMSPSVIAMLCIVFNVMRREIYGKR